MHLRSLWLLRLFCCSVTFSSLYWYCFRSFHSSNSYNSAIWVWQSSQHIPQYNYGIISQSSSIHYLLFTSFRMDGDWLVLVYQRRIEADFLSNIMNERPHSSLTSFLFFPLFPIPNSDKRKSLSAFNSSYGFRGLYTSL